MTTRITFVTTLSPERADQSARWRSFAGEVAARLGSKLAEADVIRPVADDTILLVAATALGFAPEGVSPRTLERIVPLGLHVSSQRMLQALETNHFPAAVVRAPWDPAAGLLLDVAGLYGDVEVAARIGATCPYATTSRYAFIKRAEDPLSTLLADYLHAL